MARVVSKPSHQTYTPDEARAMLPLVRPIVLELLDAYETLEWTGRALAQIGRRRVSTTGGRVPPMYGALRADVARLSALNFSLLSELALLGVDCDMERRLAIWYWTPPKAPGSPALAVILWAPGTENLCAWGQACDPEWSWAPVQNAAIRWDGRRHLRPESPQ